MSDEKTTQAGCTSDKFWNYHPPLPLKFAPYYDTPFNFKAAFLYWAKTWKPLSTQFLFLIIAILVWLYFTPSLERTKEFQLDWILEIWLRDIILILMVAGSLHTYFHIFKKQGNVQKYDKRELANNNKRFHFNSQIKDNIFWTLTSGVTVWVAWEAALLWAYANGYATLITITENPIWFVALLLFVPVWALIFFNLQHRVMHNEFLYKHVHSWHHKNGNTGPWSGLAMHPIEHLVLMTDTIIYVILPSHPVHVIYNLLFHGLGAPTTHTGFESLKLGEKHQLKLGDFFHQLHHRFFDVNYGDESTPWDKWRNSFHDGTIESHKEFLKRRKTLRTH